MLLGFLVGLLAFLFGMYRSLPLPSFAQPSPQSFAFDSGPIGRATLGLTIRLSVHAQRTPNMPAALPLIEGERSRNRTKACFYHGTRSFSASLSPERRMHSPSPRARVRHESRIFRAISLTI